MKEEIFNDVAIIVGLVYIVSILGLALIFFFSTKEYDEYDIPHYHHDDDTHRIYSDQESV